MIEVSDEISIGAPSSAIVNWFENLPDNYVAWHPGDHVRAVVRTSRAKSLLDVGTELYSEERIGNWNLKILYRIDQVDEDRYIHWVAGFPYRLLNVRGDFSLQDHDDGTLFRARIRIGWSSVIGKLVDAVIHLLFPVEQLHQHVRQEGIYLKQEVESHCSSSNSTTS